MAGDFKPNIYPVIYWALAYGLVAGFLLFLIFLLSRYITLFWFPVFAVGLIWGGFRNYQKQKRAWAAQSGAPLPKLTPVAEFREAVSDVVQASREMVAEQRAEDAALRPFDNAQGEQAQGERPQEEEIAQTPEVSAPSQDQFTPPQPPLDETQGKPTPPPRF